MAKPPDGTPRRRCGDCTACCTVMGVKDLDPPKPPGARCPQVCSRGCRIYEFRPDSCREFACVWVQGGLPKQYRPDRVGVVFGVNETGDILIGHADPARPEFWRTVPGLFEHLASVGRRGAEVWMGTSGTGRVELKFTEAGVVHRPDDAPDPPPESVG
jgi:hypothetical protein